MKKLKKITIVIILLFTIMPFAGIAQTGIPDPDDSPIDGGLSLLLAAGAAYGVKKYRDGKKKGKEDEPEMK